MFHSIPDYRRFKEDAVQRVRKDRQRTSPDRLGRMLFNVMLLAGLWGVPLYARWVILADIDKQIAKPEQPPEEAQGTIVGKWRATDGTHYSITFTKDEQFILSWKETILETAHYWFFEEDEEEIVIDAFHEQPGDRLIVGDEKWWFRATVKGEKLSTSPTFRILDHFRHEPLPAWHKHRQMDGEEMKLLPAVFGRVE